MLPNILLTVNMTRKRDSASSLTAPENIERLKLSKLCFLSFESAGELVS